MNSPAMGRLKFLFNVRKIGGHCPALGDASGCRESGFFGLSFVRQAHDRLIEFALGIRESVTSVGGTDYVREEVGVPFIQ